jgi:hypothetical protein
VWTVLFEGWDGGSPPWEVGEPGSEKGGLLFLRGFQVRMVRIPTFLPYVLSLLLLPAKGYPTLAFSHGLLSH